MKIIYLTVFIFMCTFSFLYGQSGTWTWENGDSLAGSTGRFGTQGLPDSSNTPPAFYEACQWTDLNGNFWLFGGSLGDFYNDLWEYNPSTNQWTWVKGSGVPNDTGHYGPVGTASIAYYPAERACAATWVDMSGNLWLYGGVALASNSLRYIGGFSDLWRYNIASNSWALIKGSPLPNLVLNNMVYGVKGIPSPNNTPGYSWETDAAWVDEKNNLWLFGNGNQSGSYNDTWKYDISTNEWTWMSGADSAYQPATYGKLGVPDTANVPSARMVWASWKDFNNKLWMFGGEAIFPIDSGRSSYSVYYNDLWRFDPSINQWAWMSGDTLNDSYGTYSGLCNNSTSDHPGGRFETRSHWIDDCGNFWMFGGNRFGTSMNDLWCFNPTNLKWTCASGSPYPFAVTALFGSKGIASANNNPGSRNGAIGWFRDNELYLFGGLRPEYPPGNDLWKYTIDPNCPDVNHADASVTVSGNTLIANATDATYQWIDCSKGVIAAATNKTFEINSNGNYAVMVTEFGCTNTSRCFSYTSTDVISLKFNSSIQVFPNPTDGILTLTWKDLNDNVGLIIYDMQGKPISTPLSVYVSSAKFDVSKLAPGVYFICLVNNKTFYRTFAKFIKVE